MDDPLPTPRLRAVAALLRGAGEALLRLPLPPRCPGCGTVVDGDHRFCLACWRDLDFMGPPGCARCGMPFAIDRGMGALCGPCMADPPAFDHAAAAVGYGPVAATLALKLKYGRRPGLARTMARFMERLLPDAPGDALLVPVPLHRRRLWVRGYNQSLLLARALGRRRGLAVAATTLVRLRHTPPLRGLGPKARQQTVRGAFAVPAAERARVEGRTILLVDDVLTTGATADACARALRRAGAAEVRLLCWARVVIADGEDAEAAWADAVR